MKIVGFHHHPLIRSTSILLLLLNPIGAFADYSEPYAPVGEQRLAEVAGFVPDNWKAIALAAGDLNNDDAVDYALIIQKTDSDNVADNGGLVATVIDTNPRHLLFLFRVTEDNEEKLIRKRIYRKFIPTMDAASPDMVEPVSYLGINDGVFEIKFKLDPQDDSWSRADITYRFRFDPDRERFQLIHYENHSVNKATAMFKRENIDLLTGQQEKAYGSMSSPRHRKDLTTFTASASWTMCDIKQPLHFRPK